MKIGLPILQWIVLVAYLWGMPATVRAERLQPSLEKNFENVVKEAGEQTLHQTELIAEANGLFQRGLAAYGISQYQVALEFWREALAIYRELDSRPSEANTLVSLGTAHRSLGEYEQAIDLQQQALDIATEIGDRRVQASALVNLGNAYHSRGEHERAIDFQQRALDIAREIGNRREEAASLDSLGSAHNNLGEYERAIDFHQQAIDIATEIGDSQIKVITLINLGNAYDNLGEYEQAIDAYQQALDNAREIGDRQGEANALGNLGIVYQSLGEYERAIDLHQQSLDLATEIGARPGEAASLGNLGIVYNNLGEHEQAINFYQQALDNARKIGDRQSEAASLGNLGTVYQGLGEYERAIDFLQKYLEIAKELGNREGEVSSLNNLGNAYERLGEYEQAINFHRQALDIAKFFGNRRGEAALLGNLGNAYERLGEYERAINFHQQALSIKREIGDREGEAASLNNLGLTWENQKQPDIAAIFYKSAINVYETIRADITGLDPALQESYISSVENPYRNLIDILLEQGRILEAQQVIELLKVEELREFTRASYSNGQLEYDPIEQPIINAHHSIINLGAEISTCDPNCDQTLYTQQITLKTAFDDTVETLEATIRQNRADDDVFYDPTSLASDALDIVNAQDGTVLIYPVVLEDTLWLLWTGTGGVVGSIEVPAANQANLSRAVLRFRELLTQRNSGALAELKQVGQQLHSWLIEPLSAELAANNIQHIVFAQDRATRYLPMGALHDGEKFLLENYTISTVLSAALTDTTDRLGEVEAANALGLGLDQAQGDFSALPNVRKELQTIIREGETDTTGIYPGSVFMNEDFTFDTLSQQVRHHRILHIATHAEFTPKSKGASYLLDGNGNQLSIDQIGSLDTQFNNLHLVVLSACQTALGGESLDGTEIAGISSYFLGKNKAEAVLATLWRVDDAGTSLLMQRFYEFMATGELTKAEALRQAQLSLLNSEPTLNQRFEKLGLERGGFVPENESDSSTATLDHPYYWAPFILIGNHL